MSKDYTKNRRAAEELADKLRDWWHRRGHVGVKVWVEEDRQVTSFGTKLPAHYSLQSNIVMNVASIPDRMIE